MFASKCVSKWSEISRWWIRSSKMFYATKKNVPTAARFSRHNQTENDDDHQTEYQNPSRQSLCSVHSLKQLVRASFSLAVCGWVYFLIGCTCGGKYQVYNAVSVRTHFRVDGGMSSGYMPRTGSVVHLSSFR